MRTLVLGATGFIGCSVTGELIAHDHDVVALARSDATAARLAENGVEVIRGDLREPEKWSEIVTEVDAVIHVAATFSEDMGAVDSHLVDILIAQAEGAGQKIRFVYTGGCWLFGQTGDSVATEDSPFDPLASFDWMVKNSRKVFAATGFETMMIHPAMVYDRSGGAISAMLASADGRGSVEVWGALKTRWPVVHRADLARAYRLVMETGEAGQSYCVAAEKGVAVGAMAAVISRRLGLIRPPQVLTADQALAKYGERAGGPMLDQQMSGDRIARSLGWKPMFENILHEVG